jgi:hypothetical protein
MSSHRQKGPKKIAEDKNLRCAMKELASCIALWADHGVKFTKKEYNLWIDENYPEAVSLESFGVKFKNLSLWLVTYVNSFKSIADLPRRVRKLAELRLDESDWRKEGVCELIRNFKDEGEIISKRSIKTKRFHTRPLSGLACSEKARYVILEPVSNCPKSRLNFSNVNENQSFIFSNEKYNQDLMLWCRDQEMLEKNEECSLSEEKGKMSYTELEISWENNGYIFGQFNSEKSEEDGVTKIELNKEVETAKEVEDFMSKDDEYTELIENNEAISVISEAVDMDLEVRKVNLGQELGVVLKEEVSTPNMEVKETVKLDLNEYSLISPLKVPVEQDFEMAGEEENIFYFLLAIVLYIFSLVYGQTPVKGKGEGERLSKDWARTRTSKQNLKHSYGGECLVKLLNKEKSQRVEHGEGSENECQVDGLDRRAISAIIKDIFLNQGIRVNVYLEHKRSAIGIFVRV